MTYQSEVLADSPVGYWRLGETSGTNANDEGSGGNDGTYTGTYTLGQAGLDGSADKALGLFATAGYVAVGNPAALQITGAITLECLYKPNALPASDGVFHCLISKGFDGANQGYALDIRRTGGQVYLAVASYQASGDVTYGTTYAISWSTGTTYHVVGKYTGTAWKLYINGVEVASTTAASGARSTSSNVLLGAFESSGSPGRHVNGTPDEYAIYSSSLSDARIVAHATAAGLYAGGGDPPVVTAIAVAASGGAITLTTDISATEPDVADFTATIDGNPLSLSGVSGSGSSWSLLLGQRWILDGQVVTVAYSGTTWEPFAATSATNNSTVTAPHARYVQRRFGMFIHYNMSTYQNVEIADGDESPNDFAPTDLDFDQILDGAVSAGMRYAVLTVSHHDGFSLSPTAPQAHKVSASSWYGANGNRNPVAEFVAACRSRGLKVGLYYSVWNKAYKLENPGASNSAYTSFTVAAITDLLTNYGAIDSLWFDGWGWSGGTPPGYDAPFSAVPFATVYDACKALQPDCVILVNTHEGTLDHTDIRGLETAIDGDPSSTNLLPSEQCHTPRVSDYWFWKTGSSTDESAATILAQLDLLNARRCSYLLNFPPSTTGQLDAADMALLSQIGRDRLAPPLEPYVEASGAAGFPSSSRLGGVIQ